MGISCEGAIVILIVILFLAINYIKRLRKEVRELSLMNLNYYSLVVDYRERVANKNREIRKIKIEYDRKRKTKL